MNMWMTVNPALNCRLDLQVLIFFRELLPAVHNIGELSRDLVRQCGFNSRFRRILAKSQPMFQSHIETWPKGIHEIWIMNEEWMEHCCRYNSYVEISHIHHNLVSAIGSQPRTEMTDAAREWRWWRCGFLVFFFMDVPQQGFAKQLSVGSLVFLFPTVNSCSTFQSWAFWTV